MMPPSSSTSVGTPSFDVSMRPSIADSDAESRSGISSASTRCGPNARAARLVTTELSMPPDSPTTMPRRRRVVRT
jgi:hypothetical protein